MIIKLCKVLRFRMIVKIVINALKLWLNHLLIISTNTVVLIEFKDGHELWQENVQKQLHSLSK